MPGDQAGRKMWFTGRLHFFDEDRQPIQGWSRLDNARDLGPPAVVGQSDPAGDEEQGSEHAAPRPTVNPARVTARDTSKGRPATS